MDTLVADNIIEILECLGDRDKINFLSTNKEIQSLRYNVRFHSQVEYKSIKDLWCHDQFTNVTFDSRFNKDIKDIPNGVTHYTVEYDFNQDSKYCMPNRVNHLNFGYEFKQDIKDCIPNSATHLTFGYEFDQDIKDCIPNSVTHLTMHKSYPHKLPSHCKIIRF